MGHSTNVLALRGGIVFKWNVFFISSHFINYYSEYNYFFNLIKNYLYFIFKYRYKRLFRFFGIYFGFLRINITKLNTLNVSVFVYDHFFMRTFTKFFKQFAAYKFKYGLGSLSLHRKAKKSKRRKRKSIRLVYLRRLYAGFRRKEIKQDDKLFSKTFEHQLDTANIFSSLSFNFNKSYKGYVGTGQIKKYKFSFFNSRFFNVESGFRYFLLNGFFYPRFLFFRKKDMIKHLSANRFFFSFYWKMKKLANIDYNLLIKKRKKIQSKIKEQNKDLLINSKTRRSYYFKIYNFFFAKYKRHQDYWRTKNYSYKRGKTTLSLFKLFFIRNFNRFFFNNFIRFSSKKKKITLNTRFLFVIIYLSYQTRFRKIRYRKKNRKIFKYIKGRYNRFTRIVPGMVRNLLELIEENENQRFIKVINYFYILLKKWFWLLLINTLLKRFFLYFYKNFREIVFFKLLYFFQKKEDLFRKKMLNVDDINIYPLAAKTLPLDLVLRFFDWKMKRFFTINQTVWPFLKKVKKTSRFIRGFFLVGSGRFTKKQRADIKKYKYGKVRLGSYNYRLNHAFSTIRTKYGICGLKFWINISKRHTNHKYNKIHKIILV